MAIIAAACGGGGGSDEATPSSSTTTAAPATTTASPATTTTEPSAPSYDIDALLGQDELVIFNAYPPKPDHITYELPPGQADFFGLWEPGAPWETALGHVDVYRLHAFQMRHFLDDDQLRTIIDFLREHEIPLMLETEPLIPPDPAVCAHTESFEAPWDLEMAVRLKELGGQVDVIAIEEPYHFAHLLDTPEACRYSVEFIVEEVMLHVDNLRELFGEVPVGTIEPIWADPRTRPEDMAIWLDTFEAIAGEPFAFLHIDPDVYREDWTDVAVGIEAVADERGVPFGVLYTGGLEPDDGAWMQLMMQSAAQLEVEAGVTPQHVSFQSWVDWPDSALPEDDPTALTSSIVRYFGERATVEIQPDGSGSAIARVETTDGRPLAGVELDVQRLPLGRAVSTQTIEATVPEGVSEALVLMRANTEGATPGDADITVVSVSYTEGGPNLVPNPDFAAGATSWPSYGDPFGAVRAASGGLEITADPDQVVFVDGDRFAVTPGAEFQFTATYDFDGVAPSSVGIAIAFIDGPRYTIFADHVAASTGTVTTGSDGKVVIGPAFLGPTPARIIVSNDGGFDHWPVSASAEIS